MHNTQVISTDYTIKYRELLELFVHKNLLPPNITLSNLSNFATNDQELSIIWDSRKVQTLPKVENTSTKNIPKFIYLAKKGFTFDGHSMVESVLNKNGIFLGEFQHTYAHIMALPISIDNKYKILSNPNLYFVNNSQTTMAEILKYASKISSSDFTSIAVTGTNGKTSVVQILGDLWESISTEHILRMGTLGIQMGEETIPSPYPTMPDYPGFISALRMAKEEKRYSKLIFEATSHGLIEKRMHDFKVNYAVFTNLTPDHLDFHKTMDAYLEAKNLLFTQHLQENATVILNLDDPAWKHFVLSTENKRYNILGFGEAKHAELFFTFTNNKFNSIQMLSVTNKLTTINGISGSIEIIRSIDNKPMHLVTENYVCKLIGSFQHSNLLAAIASLYAQTYPLNQILLHLNKIKNIPGRLDLLENPNYNILVDYAHTPDALEKTLQCCKEFVSSDGKLLCVFGCGGDRDKTKRPVMGKIATNLANISIITSDNPRTENPGQIIAEIAAGIEKSAHIYQIEDRKQAIAKAIELARPQDIIVIAGKGHEDYQILGKTKHPFSDKLIALELINQIKASKTKAN